MTRSRSANKDAPEHLVLETFLPYRLSVLANRVSNAIAQDYEAGFGLRVPEWRVMAALGRFGANTATGLCHQTAMDKVTISRAATTLLARKFITRKTDPDDRRRTILELTAAGQRVHDEIVPVALAHEADLLHTLSQSERAQLDRLLTKLQQETEVTASRENARGAAQTR